MPMQLVEACMSAKFINLHRSWAGGKRRRGEGVDICVCVCLEGGVQHACRLCSNQARNETVRREKQEEQQRSLLRYSLILCFISCCLP